VILKESEPNMVSPGPIETPLLEARAIAAVRYRAVVNARKEKN
jgi:hypothetical protein